MIKVNSARIILVAALVAVFSASHAANAYENKVDLEQRRLFGWTTTAEDREEKYLSIYCRCCGSDEGARNIDPAATPECEAYAKEICRCPVREETGDAWWNFFSSDYQDRWNESCSTTIPEQAGIAAAGTLEGTLPPAPPGSVELEPDDDLTIAASRNGGGDN